MFKLYKREGPAQLLYYECWANKLCVVEHWGSCGEEGSTVDHRVDSDAAAKRLIQEKEKDAVLRGYSSIPEGEMVYLVVEYPIEGRGSEQALERRYALEDAFNEFVGWHGLGHVDGGSIGIGTIEVALRVVDFNIAKSTIETKTSKTKLAGFSRILHE